MLRLNVFLKINNLGIFGVQVSLHKTDDEDVKIFSQSPKHKTSYALGTWGLMRIEFFSNDILSPKHTTGYTLGTWGLMHIGSIQGFLIFAT